MALDFSKLQTAVNSVAGLANAHAKAIKDVADAQAQIDAIAASLIAAATTPAGAVGLAAVAGAVSVAPTAPSTPVSPPVATVATVAPVPPPKPAQPAQQPSLAQTMAQAASLSRKQ